MAYGCLTMLKAGLIGVPIMVACFPLVPVVALATALSEAFPPSARANDGAGAPDFAYPSAAHFPRTEEAQYVNAGRDTSGFAYPNAYWGCHSWSCR